VLRSKRLYLLSLSLGERELFSSISIHTAGIKPSQKHNIWLLALL
jgi:hypothetical protein